MTCSVLFISLAAETQDQALTAEFYTSTSRGRRVIKICPLCWGKQASQIEFILKISKRVCEGEKTRVLSDEVLTSWPLTSLCKVLEISGSALCNHRFKDDMRIRQWTDYCSTRQVQTARQVNYKDFNPHALIVRSRGRGPVEALQQLQPVRVGFDDASCNLMCKNCFLKLDWMTSQLNWSFEEAEILRSSIL